MKHLSWILASIHVTDVETTIVGISDMGVTMGVGGGR